MRSKVQIEINESNKVLGKLTDKQLEQYVSETHKKQNKERNSKGGTIQGNELLQTNRGLFGMSERKKKKARSNGGKAATSKPEWKNIVVKAGKASAKSPKHPNNILEKCIHCGFKTTLPLIRRWHNDNCKNKS